MQSFRVGAWCWIVTGTAHSLIDISTRILRSDPDEATLRTRSFDMLGLHRSYYDVTMGVSLSMGLCMVFVGVLLLRLRRLAPRQDLRATATLGLAISAAALAIAIWLEPPPPIVLFSVACVAFGLSARNSGRLAPDDDVRAPAKVRGH